MERMLGNQYFMARKFKEAMPHFEKALEKSPNDPAILKNLVFCRVVIEELDKAVKQLTASLHTNPEILVEIRRAGEAKPYRDIFIEWFNEPPATLSSANYSLAMGVLSLYCHPELAINYFQQAQKGSPNKNAIEEILRILSNENDIVETQLT